ncbi:MAG TPA: hypothetical protein VGP30_06190, partial [Candidatus Limnocylindrales bacterium]|nr:hypothetical protein [Candidatus Limnocylindrales bacterium]
FMLGLDDRADALDVGREAGEDGETALDGSDAFMLGLDGRADPLKVRGDRRDEREHVAYATVQ